MIFYDILWMIIRWIIWLDWTEPIVKAHTCRCWGNLGQQLDITQTQAGIWIWELKSALDTNCQLLQADANYISWDRGDVVERASREQSFRAKIVLLKVQTIQNTDRHDLAHTDTMTLPIPSLHNKSVRNLFPLTFSRSLQTENPGPSFMKFCNGIEKPLSQQHSLAAMNCLTSSTFDSNSMFGSKILTNL